MHFISLLSTLIALVPLTVAAPLDPANVLSDVSDRPSPSARQLNPATATLIPLLDALNLVVRDDEPGSSTDAEETSLDGRTADFRLAVPGLSERQEEGLNGVVASLEPPLDALDKRVEDFSDESEKKSCLVHPSEAFTRFPCPGNVVGQFANNVHF